MAGLGALTVALTAVFSVVIAATVLVIAKMRRNPSPRGFGPYCPDCGTSMALEDKSTFTGRDMRTYRCEKCGREEIVDNGPALWQILSDAREEAAKTDQK